MIYFLGITFIERADMLPLLVSVALVSNDGREYYAVSLEFEKERASLHKQGCILPLLSQASERKSRKVIRRDIERFIGQQTVEIWANFSAYYAVLFTQIWGSLFDVPSNVRMYDLQQILSFRGESVPKQILPHFHALETARCVRDVYIEYVQGIRLGREYQIGDLVEINHPLPLSIVSNRYRGIGIVTGWDGEELVVVDMIDENGLRSIFRVSLPYTSLRLLYRCERKL